MARIQSIGWEENTVTEEFEAANGSTITTTNARSGTYCGRISSLVSATRQGVLSQIAAAAGNGPFWVTFYVRFTTFPSAANRFFAFTASASLAAAAACYLTIDNGGLVRLFTDNAQVGSASSALSTGTWYRIEVHVDRTAAGGSQACDAQIATGDGTATQFATTSTATFTAQFGACVMGGNLAAEAQTTGDWSFDDFAINDSTGTAQVSAFPGPTKVVHLCANAAGDLNSWVSGGSNDQGGASASVNNYKNVGTTLDKPPADDTASYVTTNTLSNIDTYNVEDATSVGMTTSDTPVVVHAMLRFAGAGASGNGTIRARLYATQGGSQTEGAGITPTNASYVTCQNTLKQSTVTAYTVPGGSVALTTGAINAMLVGFRLGTVGGTAGVNVTKAYLRVAYTPSSGAGGGSSRLLMGM